MRSKSFFALTAAIITLLFTPALCAQEMYWEEPQIFSPENGSFPVSAYRGNLAAVAWQETTAGTNGGRIGVNLAVKQGRGNWIIRSGIAEYAYSGAAEPAILSIGVDDQGRMLIAAAVSAAETEILISQDLGETFTRRVLDMGSESSVAPRIFTRSDGGYLLFVTRGSSRENLTLYYSRSTDGDTWSDFEPFVPEQQRAINFLPTHTSFNGREYVVYQSQLGTSDLTFQLYFKSSNDNGRTWTSSTRITDFRDPFDQNARSDLFDNQRAHLSVQTEGLFVVWERRLGSRAPQIYGARLENNGSILGAPYRINFDAAYCNNPIAFDLKGRTAVIWFDNSVQGSNRVMMASQNQYGWERAADISRGTGGEASFGRPVIVDGDLVVFWQAALQSRNRIYSLAPDTSLSRPQLIARNFTPGNRTRNDTAIIGWNPPRAGVSVRGYSWVWSRNSADEPPKEIMSGSAFEAQEHIADEDGTWYFSVIAQDYNGAWSDPAQIVFVRDTTAPPAAQIIAPETDDNGFLLSNTFSMRWNRPPASDIAGYTWNLEYLGSASLIDTADDEELNRLAGERFESSAEPPRAILGPGNTAAYSNQDNGLWVFSVSAVDEVGNIGLPARRFFKTNKFVPYTVVAYADTRESEDGTTIMRIIGRGFASGGAVTRVILDEDGAEPYDREWQAGEFTVLNDTEINGIPSGGVPAGTYRILLEHPQRGMYVSPPIVSVDRTGTVKFGDFTQTWQPSWAERAGKKLPIDASFLVLAVIMLFGVLGLLAAARGISGAAAESAAIRIETIALITGDIMPSEKKRRMTLIKRRGGGLRLKLASFTIALVVLVVVMISSPLYVMMGRTQEATLLQGLYDRTRVLLESIATEARVFMPANNTLELGYLPAQFSVIPEAHYVTITGPSQEQTIFSDYVLATNDPGIAEKIDTGELEIGRSRLFDSLSPRTPGLEQEMNLRAQAEIGETSAMYNTYTREAMELMEIDNPSAAQRSRIDEIAATTQALQTRISEVLTEISGSIGSEPAFSTTSLTENTAENYIFFKPILYRLSSDEIYYRGLVRTEVSIESIVEQIRSAQRGILRLIILVALAAIVIGALGAMILSTLIIRPIRRLVSHVERIRDTEDKAKLEGVDISIKSNDEIATLGNTINDMTHGLVKAALAAADLSLGKEIQKKFIPLEVNREGNKLSTGFKDAKNIQFFGYYEGAKGVSGDYFDYQDLDGRYYAIIKCDVAGKGIPAALIMIQVATMFLGYFRRWKPTEKGLHIEDLVYQINDFIETLGFKGRFAAFTLCLFDSQTGLARFCNAGDNIVHWYDASERKIKTVTLRETPATGVLPNFLVESKGGYTVQTLTLDHGDTLFLYTDGIEEAKRLFRNPEFKEIICEEGEKDTPHETHTVGQGDEEMGPDRVEGIINAIMNREAYTLHKYHNPEGENRGLRFDFSSCEGKVEEAVMALVAVEKIFRMYKDPKAGEDARVLVDKKVDEFLRKHFSQYRDYCYDTREAPGNNEYMYYTHVKEDEQYDDLTILGINRK